MVTKVADREMWRDVKETLLKSVGTGTIPVIKITDADYGGNRTLSLVHDHDGRDLLLEYAERTLQHLHRLWGREVVLETFVNGKKMLLTSLGPGLRQQAGQVGSRSSTTMPIYEYRCTPCRRRVQVLTLRASEVPEAVCDRCGNRQLDRLLSRFAVARSEESRLDALSDPSRLAGLDESDPKSVARWMRRMGSEVGDDMAGPEFDQMVDELEAGGADTDDASGDAGDDPGTGEL